MLIRFDTVCRCCLRSGSLTSIFSDMITQTTVGYDAMIEYCCSVPVAKDDGLSLKICSQCIPQLTASYEFKQKCIESYTELFNFKEKISPNAKMEPILEESNDFDQASECNESDQPHNDNKIFINELKDEILTEMNENETSSEIEVKVEIREDQIKVELKEGEINDHHIVPEIPEKNKKVIRKEKKRCRKDQVRSKESKGLKIKTKKLKLTCDVCGKSHYSLNKLKQHINWVHFGIKPYHCSICNKDYLNEKRHLEKHKSYSATCDKCGVNLTSQKEHKKHIKSHNIEEYKCQCGKIFKARKYFLNHMRRVHGPKKCICHLCSKAFIDKVQLSNHIRMHTGEKPFKCEFCGMKFRLDMIRKGHIKMKHSNVCEYECKQCHKEFKTQSILSKHMSVHTERRFACRICNQPFGRSDNRNVHERSVHKIVR